MEQNQLYLIKSGQNSFVETEGEVTIGLSGGNIGFGTTAPEAFMHVTGNTQIDGDLTVKGDFTTVNSTTIQVDDKNIEIGVGATTDAAADGGGITLHGATNKTITWSDANDAWTSSEHVHTADGKHVATDQVRALDGDGLKLYDDGGNGIFVEDGGNVGVGTTNPTVALDVVGSGNFSASVSAGSSVDATTTMSAGTSLTTPLVKAAGAAGLNLQDDGGNGIFVEDGGNVGIGTSDPSVALDVVGSGNFSASVSAGTSVDATTTMSAGTSLTTPLVKAADGNGLNLQDDGGNGIFVEDGGNVGIGTSDPSATLDVVGSGNFSAGLYVNGNAVVTGDAGKWEDGVGSNEIYYSAGNVGVGTSDPSSALDVVGVGNFSQGLFVDGNAVVTGAGGKWDDGVGANEIYYDAGNVGIGTSDPSVALDVVGAGSFSSNLTVGGQVDTTNLTFDQINGTAGSNNNDVIAYNGTSWTVKAASQLGLGGGSSTSQPPSSFETAVPQGADQVAIVFSETFDSVPQIAATVEVNGEGEIIPHTVSGVSETGYYVVFSEATQTANYSVHTVFGGKDVYWETGVSNLQYSARDVAIGQSLTVSGTLNVGNALAVAAGGSVGGVSPSTDHVIKWNGSKWISAASPGGGGSSSSEVPSAFTTSLSSSNGAIHQISFAETYDNIPSIATDLEVTEGPIIPYAISGLSTAGYYAVFTQDIPSDNNYKIHTTFGGKEVYWATGAGGTSISYDGGDGIDVTASISTATLKARDGNGLNLQDDGGNGIFIEDGGNIGIGTANPLHPLHIQEGGQDGNMCVGGSASTLGLQFSYDQSLATTATIRANTNYTANGTLLKISTNNNTNQLVLKGDGNVGIGTTNPDRELEIFGGALKFGTDAVGLNEFELFPTDEGSNGLAFYDRTNSAYRMILSNAGDVGIGTTNTVSGSTSYKLFVNGRMYVESTVVLNSLTASSDVQTNAAKQLISTSDKRLKNDLGDCEYGLNEVLQVQPKKYTWKSGPEDQKPTVGFFAQDVHAIMPEAAPCEAIQNENGEDDYRWGFHSQTIIAALVNATKEQQSIIEDLKSQNESLAAQNADFESRISKLEQ